MGTRVLKVGLVVLACALVLVACAPGPNELAQPATVAGFWRGLWHGMIAPITFLISLFSHSVGVYEIHNNGSWYDCGFIVGILCHHGGHHAGRKYGRRNQEGSRA